MEIFKESHTSFAKLWSMLWLEDLIQSPFHTPGCLRWAQERMAAEGAVFENCSFVVAENGAPFLGLLIVATTNLDQTCDLSCYGLPILFLENPSKDYSLAQGAKKLFKREIEHLHQRFQQVSWRFADYLAGGQLSSFGKYLLSLGAIASPQFINIITLSSSEQELYRVVRKSYKSLINWGKKKMELRLIDGQAIKTEDIERFRLLHIGAAGKETRTKASWQLQYEMVKNREAFVIFGYLEEELVTAGFFMYTQNSCHYGTSASKRELFEKPLFHVLMWQAICYAKEKGCQFFETGDQLYPKQGDPTSKELDISTFKRGFGGETKVRLMIQLNTQEQ
jgi:hypothetical protein